MRAFYSDTFVLPLPDGHRFPMSKYRLLREAVAAAGLVAPADLRLPPAASDEELLRVHTPEYLRRVVDGALDERQQRRIGFPWSPAMVERSRRSVGGTIAAARAALEDGVGINLAGGTHHAFADRGEGFCVFNDVAVAARALQAEDAVSQLLVLDADVHQGNGTAAIFAGDPTVCTVSIHGSNNFPYRKETGDLDLELPDGAGDEEYLAALDTALEAGLAFAPGLVFYLAGADPYAADRYGRLALSRGGLARRDRTVFAACRNARLPVAVVMAGGYAAVEEVVAIHLETVRLARRIVAPRARSRAALA